MPITQQDTSRYQGGKEFTLQENQSVLGSLIRLTFSKENLEMVTLTGDVRNIITNALNQPRENGISLIEKYGVQDFETFSLTSPENQKNVLYALNDLFSNHLPEIKQAYKTKSNKRPKEESEDFIKGLDEIQYVISEKSEEVLQKDIAQNINRVMERQPLNLEEYGEASLMAMQAHLQENKKQIMQQTQKALPQNKALQKQNKQMTEAAVSELSDKINARLTTLANQRASAERIASVRAQASQPQPLKEVVSETVERTVPKKSIDLGTYEDMAMMASIVIPLSRNPACQERIQAINQIAAVNGDHTYKAMLLAGMLVEINQQLGKNPDAKVEKCLQEFFDTNGIDRAAALKEHQTYSRAMEKAKALADKPAEPVPETPKSTASVTQTQVSESVTTTSETKPIKVSRDENTRSKFGGRDVATFEDLRDGIRAMLKAHKSDHMLGGLFMSSKKWDSIARLEAAINACEKVIPTSHHNDDYDVRSRIDIRDKLIEVLVTEAEKFSSTRFNSSEESAYKSRIKNLLDDKLGGGGYEKARKEYCKPAVAQGETVAAVTPEQHGPHGN